jgi:hypothetical protein
MTRLNAEANDNIEWHMRVKGSRIADRSDQSCHRIIIQHCTY